MFNKSIINIDFYIVYQLHECIETYFARHPPLPPSPYVNWLFDWISNEPGLIEWSPYRQSRAGYFSSRAILALAV